MQDKATKKKVLGQHIGKKSLEDCLKYYQNISIARRIQNIKLIYEEVKFGIIAFMDMQITRQENCKQRINIQSQLWRETSLKIYVCVTLDF